VTSESRKLSEQLPRIGASHAVLAAAEQITYTTGFDPPPPIDAGAALAAGPTLAIIDAEGRTCLIAPSPYAAIADATASVDHLLLVEGFGHFEPVNAAREYRHSVRRALDLMGIDSSSTVAADSASLSAETRALLPGAAVELGAAFADARRVKTTRELELLRAASRAADAGQDALSAALTPGITEFELAASAVAAAHRTAQRAVPCLVDLVSGPRTGTLRYPGGPEARTLQEGDTVIFDFGVRIGGYWSDTTNTLACGEPSPEQRRYARAAQDAFDAAAAALSPGARASEAHIAASAAFGAHGLEIGHYSGHQIGVAVNEEPRLVPYDQTIVEAGMIFAVEPGAYAGRNGQTGARAEKVVLVTDDGPEIISRFTWGISG
jgi:Xaa-Pro dipeptidase